MTTTKKIKSCKYIYRNAKNIDPLTIDLHDYDFVDVREIKNCHGRTTGYCLSLSDGVGVLIYSSDNNTLTYEEPKSEKPTAVKIVWLWEASEIRQWLATEYKERYAPL